MADGLDKGYENRAQRVTRLEDSANLKSVLLHQSEKVLFGFASKYRLTDDDVIVLDAAVKKALTNSMDSKPSSLRELMVETIRDAMKKRGLEVPGLRDDYLEELNERMKVRIEKHA